MKRFNFFKYTTLGNKVDTTYFDYWFFKKLVATGGEPTPPIEGEGTDFELEAPTRKKFDVIELKGDTTQTTYSGKNLLSLMLNSSSSSSGSRMNLESISDNAISLKVLTSHNYAAWTLLFDYSALGLTAGQTLTLSCNAIVSEADRNPSIRIAKGTSGANTDIIASWYETTGSVTFELPSDVTSFSLWFYANQGAPAPSVGTTVTFSDIQLELGSTATPFEPYVGGIASPNPDYPQDVNVVTGTQTLTITNGTDVQTYPITLGSIELAKIGNYQDYIYKSGDDWYVHKEVGKVLLTGSENWVLMSTTARRTAYYTIISDMSPYTNSNNTPEMISNHFIPVSENGTWTQGLMSREKNNTNRAIFCMNPSLFTTTTDFTTWLSNNNTSLYYSLATLTDTQITDTTLISNLETILADGHLKKGTNAIKTTATSTNLPTIIYIKTN